MSEYLLRKYRPVADALLAAHGLTVPDATRDNLAGTVMRFREVPAQRRAPGDRSSLDALKVARTHARKLIEYATKPPARANSVALRCDKLAAAIGGSDLAALELGISGVNPSALLDDLAARKIDPAALDRLIACADAREAGGSRIGRPWALATYVIREGCIVWARAGRTGDAHWIMDDERLVGPQAAFMRDLITCCDGTHDLVQELVRRAQLGRGAPHPEPQGNALRRRVSDLNIRDGIAAWERWLQSARRKNPDLSL